MKVRVLLVDDHTAVREATAAMFGREAGFVVIGQATTMADARPMLAKTDLLVVDLGLPDGFGGDLITELLESNPRARALVLTASPDPADHERARQCGAETVLSKITDLDRVVDAARRL